MRGRVEIELTVTGITSVEEVSELIKRADAMDLRTSYTSPMDAYGLHTVTVKASASDPVTVWDAFSTFVSDSGITA